MTESGLANIRAADSYGKSDISYGKMMAELNETFLSGKTVDLGWRKQQLKQAYKMGIENFDKITEALDKDIGGGKSRALAEVPGFTLALDALKNLDKWAERTEVQLEEPQNTGNAKAYYSYVPKGVVLCIGPWNFPFILCIQPMIDIISAGNCCVIKPSEVSGNTSRLLAELIPKYMDPAAVRVVEGGVPETTALLKEKFDHIIYTGNGFVGKIVMTAAAKHLTPVTLELGGKSPTYVDKSANLDLAVQRICRIKFLNAGQICIAPDYLMLHKDIAAKFKEKLLEEVTKYADLPIGKIINERHEARIQALGKASTGNVIAGDKSTVRAPMIVDSPEMEDNLMKEEIFGPILPIHEVTHVDHAIEIIAKVCDTPLAIYIYADVESVKGRKTVDYFINKTRSGGVSVNQCLEQVVVPGMPFGGVGSSGMGQYRGVHGFQEFSHKRGVFEKDSKDMLEADIPPPPEIYDAVVAQLTAIGETL